MFQRIVVGTDGSAGATSAVELAAKLAERDGATLHLVSAYTAGAAASVALATAGTGAGELSAAATEIERDRVTGLLTALASRLGARHVATESHAMAGPAPEAILEVATRVGADLIVVGSRGMKGARRILGSVPNSVAHHADCHVLIAKTV